MLQPTLQQAAKVGGEASVAHVNLQEAPSAWTYERRASVKLAKSQLCTVKASFENPSLEPKARSFWSHLNATILYVVM